MKKIFVLALLVAVLGCSKKENDEYVLKFQSLLDKYMICDSIKTTLGTTSAVQKLGKGKGFDMKFSSDGTFTLYSNPETKRFFYLESPYKLYYYKDEVDESEMYIVPSVTSSNLVLRNTDSLGKTYVRYFTAE